MMARQIVNPIRQRREMKESSGVPFHERTPFARYAVALVSVAVAFVLRLFLDPLMEDDQPVATFYLAVLVSSWYGGFRPGLLAMLLGFPLADWFFIPPRHTFAISFARHWIAMSVFVVVSGTIAYVVDSLRRSRRRAEQCAQDAAQKQEALAGEVRKREQAEQALRQNEEKFRRIFESASAGIWVVDKEERITLVNKSMAEILGYTPDEIRGRRKADFVAASHRGLAGDSSERRHLGSSELSDVPLQHKDGREVWTLMSARPIYGSDGQPDGALDMFADITERKVAEVTGREEREKLEARVRERTGELIESNRALEASNRALEAEIRERKQLEREILEVSEREQRRVGQDLHDGLSQLLRGMAYLSQILHENLAKRSLPEAQDAARVTQLINEALAHARGLARGLFPVGMEADGLMSALHDLAARVQEIYKMPCRFDCHLPILVEDNTAAIHLYRIAQEAVSNALQHGRPSQIVIALSSSESVVRLTVEDNGQGLPPEADRHRGMGIKIMNYRARTIGALLNLRRAPGGGTRVMCSWQTERTRPTE